MQNYVKFDSYSSEPASILSLYLDSLHDTIEESKISHHITDDPIAVFSYAVKSPESKKQYPRRLKMFLDFLNLSGDL
jgi:hypothetical protein